MRLTAAELATVVDGRVEGADGVALAGVEVDTRRLVPGDLFIALPGARHDGHEFVGEALAGPASAALVRTGVRLAAPPPGRALVRVDDPLEAYHRLARWESERRRWQVVAITGSVAKTTTKDFLAHLLAGQRRIGMSRGNRNSTLGLPAELLSQGPEVEVFVAEAGMSRPGELALLGPILRPSVVLYTRIAPVHTEFFPDLETIAAAKAELLPHLDPEGTLVVNLGDPQQRHFPGLTAAESLGYGTPAAPVRAEAVDDRGLLGSRFRLVLPSGQAPIELAVAGRHQIENLVAAAAAASTLGLGAEAIAEAASGLRATSRRGRLIRLEGGITLVDDSYNASPLAVGRMLELLAAAPGRRVAVLGEMYELGELSPTAHREAGRSAAAACDLLVAVGGADARRLAAAARAAGLGAVHEAEDAAAAARLLADTLRPGDVVLVKGSRGVGLDETVDAVAGREAA